MANWRALSAVVFGVLTASVSLPRSQQAPTPVGCYRLELGPWSKRSLLPARLDSAQVPPVAFRLDSAVADTGRPALKRAEPKNPRVTSGSPWPMWYRTGPHSVDVVWSTGFVGVKLRLVQAGDTLRGVAQTFTDTQLLGGPSAVAMAVRIPCSQMPAKWAYAR